ncbi:MAG TPA: ATP-binding protein [Rhodanobacteraceae bacterium]|nr:ATP-binding protein [Rhodanobacteraceae bacterium]
MVAGLSKRARALRMAARQQVRSNTGPPAGAPQPVQDRPRARHPLSLAARSVWATGLVLLVFLGATGFALDRAYAQGARSAMRDRLQSYAYAYMARVDVSRYGTLIPPDVQPNPDFMRPGSGLYAAVTGPGIDWVSPSALGRDLPMTQSLRPAQTLFRGPLETALGAVYVLSEGVAWVLPDGSELNLTFHIAENQRPYLNQLHAFRRTLMVWLTGIGCALLLLQLLLLRWSLAPLRRISRDLAEIERGARDHLPADYPAEVAGMASGLNNFIDSERDRIFHYRNILADLAHSLKTPLAVMRSRLDLEEVTEASRQGMVEQLRRMDEIVAYQLSRAATSGHPTFAAPIRVEPQAEDLVRSLEKVYAGKNVLCEFEIEPRAQFYGERGDLMELMGNLLENAFKWANHRVLVRAHVLHFADRTRPGLELGIEDDGPGIPVGQLERILQRGVRGDERTQGTGIGLAIVQDIVRAYQADFEVGPSQDLGGASFVVRFTPP